MNVALIGYRGSGKTTVAGLLAQQLTWDWADADERLERFAQKSIAEIFAEEGEQAFRDYEAQILLQLLAQDHMVLALGGGVVLRSENREALRRAKIVWLRAQPACLLERIESDPLTQQRRPNLTARGGIEEIRTLLAQREPLYQQCADYIVDVEGKTPEQIASHIVSLLGHVS